MIFVDTSAWYALEVEDDVNHEAACKFLSIIASGKYGISVTTDYILDETITLLWSRRSPSSASAFINKIMKSKSVRVFWVEDDLFEKALDMFKRSDGKSWSFTDCTSFALIKDLSIPNAFTFDNHFREAGLQILL
ncbi:MAG: type II toxin-antitoxin system VapC family toxin [Candidatus Bathyarchaeia archaeon]